MQPTLKIFLVLVLFASSLQLTMWIGKYLRFGWMLLEDFLINQQFLEPSRNNVAPTLSFFFFFGGFSYGRLPRGSTVVLCPVDLGPGTFAAWNFGGKRESSPL